jgi:hypothetical protein
VSLRFEERRVQVAYQWFRNGYELRCHDCTPEESRPEMEFATDTYKDQPCGLCGRLVGSVTVETTARVAIEYFACKIF